MESNIHSFEKSSENDNKPQSQNFLDFQNYIESSLKLSEIENKENEQTKKFDTINSYNFESISISNQTKKNKKKVKNLKRKLTKEGLNNIPLPIFSCIYCSNDEIAFNHLIKENLYNKYYLQISVYDIKLINKIMEISPIIDNYNKNIPIVNVILKNTEFIRQFYKKKEIKTFFLSEKIRKKCEDNINKATKLFLQKLEDKIIRKRNKEMYSNKYNSNKLLFSDDHKASFQKPNNNSTFTNDNLTTNKNSMTNTLGTGSFPNIGLSSSLNINNNENINNNNNNYFNQNNIMESIMEKIEKNEESDSETEEKFLNILENKNNSTFKINKNEISFEQKFYDIWNPDITFINEVEEDNNKNVNFVSDRNIKKIKKIINLAHKKKKICKIDYNSNNNCKKNIINYNNGKKIDKKIIYKRNIFSPFINNSLKKRNLMDLINYKNRRNFRNVPHLLKEKFFTKDNNNNNKNLDMINNLISARTKGDYNNTVSQNKQNPKKNLLCLLKSKSCFIKGKNKINKLNSGKLIRKETSSSKTNLSNIIRRNNDKLSNFSLKQNSMNLNSDLNNLSKRKNNEINLDIDINNKNVDILSKYLMLTNRSLLCSSLQIKNSFTSLPNLKINLSPIYNYKHKNDKIKMNTNKKIRIKSIFKKINSYNFFQNRCVSLSKPLIKIDIFGIK